MAGREAFIERLAPRLLAPLARRFFWVDREELCQFIFLAALEISDAYADRSEDERGAIAYKAAYRMVAREVLKASSPVSESWHNLTNLKQAKGASLDNTVLESLYPRPDEVFERAQTVEWVRRATRVCAVDVPLGRLATRVLLDEETPRAISDETGVHRREIYRAVDQLKRKLKPVLKEHLNGYSFCG